MASGSSNMSNHGSSSAPTRTSVLRPGPENLTVQPSNVVGRRRPSTGGQVAQYATPEDHPNHGVYKRLLRISEKMQDRHFGVPVKNIKSFLVKTPSVFTGMDIVNWLMRHIDIDDQLEAMHIGQMLVSHCYFFPVDDHLLVLKNDGALYRFQTPCLLLVNMLPPDDYAYAVYLCKRTMQNKQRLELCDYEAENLARLQKAFSRKWDFICLQAEAQVKVDKKRDKIERKILDTQERAYWDLHRPPPGCISVTEIDVRKSLKMSKLHSHTSASSAAAGNLHRHPKSSPLICGGFEGENHTDTSDPEKSLRSSSSDAMCVPNDADAAAELAIFSGEFPPSAGSQVVDDGAPSTPSPAPETVSVDALVAEVKLHKRLVDRRRLKISKISELLISYSDQYQPYDAFLSTPELPNPWMSDSTEFWDQAKEVSSRRLKRWEFSVRELLSDPLGKEMFAKFLQREFSSENLSFYDAVQQLHCLPLSKVAAKVQYIYRTFLAEDATMPINIDSSVMEKTRRTVQDDSSNRFCFDSAEEQIFNLMARDSYNRFLRSDMYKELLNSGKKKQPFTRWFGPRNDPSGTSPYS